MAKKKFDSQQAAQALVEKRKREGRWGGTVQPHTEYQDKPLEWITEKLGVPEETLRWSMSEEYGACDCESEICTSGPGQPHQWDGDPDPLIKVLEAIAEGEDTGVESATGTGKCQPVDEPVLTPTGWRAMGELQVGDFVIGSDGQPTEVIGTYPQGRKPVYRLIFSDGASTRACGDHFWVMKCKSDRHRSASWRLLQTKELLDGKNIAQKSYTVPRPSPIAYQNDHDLPLPPYLLGALLGDGGFRGGFPVLSSGDEEVIARVESLLPAGLSTKRAPDSYDYRITGPRNNDSNPVTDALREMGLWGKKSDKKFVPPIYLTASPEDRLELLRGLMDTDGTAATRGKHVAFSSSSRRLSVAVVQLVRSLGGTAKMRKQPSTLNGERMLDRYRVAVNMPDGRTPFHLRRKAEIVENWGERTYGRPERTLRSIEEVGVEECVCIKVAALDSLYVTKDFIVTHNTYTAACIVYWFLACFEDSLVITAAPKKDQLLFQVWKEIGRLWPKFQRLFPEAEYLTGKIRMRPAAEDKEVWAAMAFVAGVGADEEAATKAQGFHAEHMLIITEETPGMHPAIMTAFDNTRTDDHNIQLSLGNPDHRHDPLHQFCEKEWVNDIRISAYDHPNVVTGRRIVPGAIGQDRLKRRIKDYGKGSRLYESRVRGISPSESETALIRWDWCVAAAERYDDPSFREGGLALGVDVADAPTGDPSSIARWQGACLTEVVDFHAEDASFVGELVEKEARDPNYPVDPRHIGIDPVGVGASAINEMRRRGLKVRHIGGNYRAIPSIDQDDLWSETETDLEGNIKSAGPKVVEAERFRNLRAQVWWKMREDLRLGRIALPNDPELFHDLTAPEYGTQNGVIYIEPKEDLKKRLGRSPNKGDATVYGNFVRRRRPQRLKADSPVLENTENRDRGLERLLARQEKANRKRRRQVQRMLKGMR